MTGLLTVHPTRVCLALIAAGLILAALTHHATHSRTREGTP